MNWIWICWLLIIHNNVYDQIHLTTLGYTNEIKSEGQIQCLNLHGLKDNIYKAFYGVHLWICEYVGVKMKQHPTPWEIKRNSCSSHTAECSNVSLCFSAQVFFPFLLLLEERNCRLCGALKNRCLGFFLHEHLSLWRKLQSKDPCKPGIPSPSVST